MLINPLLTSYLEMRLVVIPYIVVSAFRRGTSEKTAMISLAVIFGLLAVGMVLVAHGTVAKNKWGINLRRGFLPTLHLATAKAAKAPVHSTSHVGWLHMRDLRS
jgi:hypothetical protein